MATRSEPVNARDFESLAREKLAAYKALARKCAKIWREHGALEFRECVADDVPVGKRTSFPRSVKLKKARRFMMS